MVLAGHPVCIPGPVVLLVVGARLRSRSRVRHRRRRRAGRVGRRGVGLRQSWALAGRSQADLLTAGTGCPRTAVLNRENFGVKNSG